MREPRRWLEGDAPAGVRELLRQGEAPRPLSEQARARSRSRVAALSALPVAAGFMLWLPQVALGAVLGAAGTGLVVMASERFKDPPPLPTPASPKAAPRPASRQPVAPAPAPAPLESVAPVPAPAPVAVPPSGGSYSTSSPRDDEPPSVRNSLDREIALLEQARRQLLTNPSGALSVLRRHETEFPGGQLRIEREFLIVDALVRSGNRSAAEARVRALEAQAPRSLYGERLKRILSGDSR